MNDEIEGHGAKQPPTQKAEEQAVVTIEQILVNIDSLDQKLYKKDKHRNEDGYVEVLDSVGKTFGRIYVQVRKLHSDDISSPKLSGVRVETLKTAAKIYNEPFLLIGVDTKNSVGYWTHISQSFLDKLDISEEQSYKTIHFSENNTIGSNSSTFVEEWIEIIKENRKGPFYQKFKHLKERADPSIKKTKPEYKNTQQFLDEYNHLVEKVFPIIKRRFYPESWKVGIAINRYSEDFIEYSPYAVPEGTNDLLIKEINVAGFQEIADKVDNSTSVRSAHPNPIFNNPKEYAKKRASENMLNLIEDRNLSHKNSVLLAREHLFDFVAKYHEFMGLEPSDSYSLYELKRGISQLESFLDVYFDQTDDRGRYYVLRDGHVDLERLFFGMTRDRRNEIMELAKDSVKQESEIKLKYPIGDRWRNPIQIQESLELLTNQDLSELTRPFHYPLYYELPFSPERIIHRKIMDPSPLGQIFNQYSNNQIRHNFEQVFYNLFEVYDSVIQENFPRIADEIPLFDPRIDGIIVQYQIPESDFEGMLPPAYSIYLLSGDLKQGEKPVVQVEEWDESKHPEYDETIEIEEEQFELIGITMGRSSFAFSNLPLTMFLYDKLESNLETHFENWT